MLWDDSVFLRATLVARIRNNVTIECQMYAITGFIFVLVETKQVPRKNVHGLRT